MPAGPGPDGALRPEAWDRYLKEGDEDRHCAAYTRCLKTSWYGSE